MKILIVDDDPQLRSLTWVMLKRAGHSPPWKQELAHLKLIGILKGSR